MPTSPPTVRAHWVSPLGAITLAARGDALTGIWFDGQKHQPDTAAWPLAQEQPVLLRACNQLREYFAGERRNFDLPLDLSQGTAFQRQVWHALLGVRWGACLSYGALSTVMDRPGAVRAVAAAVGRNPLSIVVPCHRILGAHGALTGYAGGLPRKAALLALEGRG
jgi:methylated-DNA-[protein]-cysteine S-methyltransferase